MQHLRVLTPLLLAVTACASAGTPSGDDDNATPPDATVVPPDAETIQPRPDADPGAPDAMPPPPDAEPAPDAGPNAVTLSQNNATNLVAGNSIACSDQVTGFTDDNSYYRVFDLTAMGVAGQFTAESVTFGIETSDAHNAEVKLYRLTGAFTLANLTALYTQPVSIPAVADGAPQAMTVPLGSPVVVAAGSKLVVEVHSPDLQPTSKQFFIGSNTAGETGASYIKATGCSVTQPETMAQAGFANVHIVLTVAGTSP
jgi:hypothetical protein